MLHGLDEKRGAVLQRDPQRVRIGSSQAHLSKILQLTLVERLCTDHVMELVGVFRAQRRREDAAIRRDEVLRRDGIAVGPLGRRAQKKRVDPPVLRNLPPLGHTTHRVGTGRPLGHESFKERIHDFVFRHARDDLRIDILRFGAVAEIQDRALPGADRRCAQASLGF